MGDEKMDHIAHEFEYIEEDQLGYNIESDLNLDGELSNLEKEAAQYGDFSDEKDFLDWKKQLHEAGMEELGKQENDIFEDPGLFHHLLEQNQVLTQELKQITSS